MTAHQSIVAAYKSFEEAYLRGDAETISQMYTDDAQLLAPEAPIIKGREAIGQVWKGLLGTGGNHVRVEVLEVQESGDWAYEIGRFVATAADGRCLNAGKYLVIWKRDETGQWKTHRDVMNWDVPPVAEH
jgi:ketosteroid isomerase-like protein